MLPVRYRRIAKVLASGESTRETAKRFKLSSGRISQIRAELKQSWQAFQGEPVAAAAVAYGLLLDLLGVVGGRVSVL